MALCSFKLLDRQITFVGLTLLFAIACTGSVGSVSGNQSGNGDSSNGGDGGTASTGSNNDGGAGANTVASCQQPSNSIGPAPLRRLSRTEYFNTIKELLPGVTFDAISIPPDNAVGGFFNNALTQTATPVLADSYLSAGKTIASSISNMKTLFGCDPATAGCPQSFISTFGKRAFRRPLLPEESASYLQFFNEAKDSWDVESAARLLVQGFLASPNFLYRPELGVGGPSNGKVALTPYEVATRLSYFVWQSMPDADLFTAASSGALDTADGVEKQVRRMLADPRARTAIADFNQQWLRLEGIKNTAKDQKLFPNFKPELPTELFESASRYVADNFWEGDATIQSLLTSNKAFVNADVAPLYGISGVSGSDYSMVKLDPAQRSGLLTQAGVLASLAHERMDSPILRGIYVLRELLCTPPPPPPANVPALEPPMASDAPKTTRQRVQESHSRGSCMSCHATIDGVGFMFSQYDALGQFRTTDNGLPVDATAKLVGIDDSVDGAYNNIREFSTRVAESPLASACAAVHMFRFAMGRSEESNDDCLIQDAMKAAKGNLRELIVHLSRSDAQRFRPVAQ